MGFLTKLPGTRLVVRKPGGYSICVPCPTFYMGSEYRSSGSHTAHALTHTSATLQTDIYMHALFPFPITPHKLNGADINTHSVNLKYTYSYTCVYTHVPWPSPHNKNIYNAPNTSRSGTGAEAKAIDTKSLNSIFKGVSNSRKKIIKKF